MYANDSDRESREGLCDVCVGVFDGKLRGSVGDEVKKLDGR